MIDVCVELPYTENQHYDFYYFVNRHFIIQKDWRLRGIALHGKSTLCFLLFRKQSLYHSKWLTFAWNCPTRKISIMLSVLARYIFANRIQNQQSQIVYKLHGKPIKLDVIWLCCHVVHIWRSGCRPCRYTTIHIWTAWQLPDNVWQQKQNCRILLYV